MSDQYLVERMVETKVDWMAVLMVEKLVDH